MPRVSRFARNGAGLTPSPMAWPYFVCGPLFSGSPTTDQHTLLRSLSFGGQGLSQEPDVGPLSVFSHQIPYTWTSSAIGKRGNVIARSVSDVAIWRKQILRLRRSTNSRLRSGRNMSHPAYPPRSFGGLALFRFRSLLNRVQATSATEAAYMVPKPTLGSILPFL